MITLSPEEFNTAIKRIHRLLTDRAARAQARKQAKPSERADAGQIRTAEDVFVFVHMMELVEYLSAEIGSLRQLLTVMGSQSGEDKRIPELFTIKKTNFIN